MNIELSLTVLTLYC